MVDKPEVQIGRPSLFTKYIMKEFLIVCVYVPYVCLGKGVGGMWTELMWFRAETVEEFVQGKGSDQLDRPCEK